MLAWGESREVLTVLARSGTGGSEPEARQNGEAGSIFRAGALPREGGQRRWLSLAIALCAEGAALAAVTGHGALCALLLVGGVWAFGWRAAEASGAKSGAREHFPGLMGAVAALALLLAASLTTPWRTGAVQGAGDAVAGRNSGGPRPAEDSSWVGVILWPKMPRAVKVVAPPPLERAAAIESMRRPLVIPFEGAYWYFRSPAKGPGARAHIARGSPAAVDIHSSDWHPLIMEAHQALGAPIDLRCCGELDLVIENHDNRPGRIGIAVNLIDTSSGGVASEDLGARPVVSSEPGEFSLNRPPVEETLRYAIPADASLARFNEIEVVFLPAAERSLGGVQIAIREFRLLPSMR